MQPSVHSRKCSDVGFPAVWLTLGVDGPTPRPSHVGQDLNLRPLGYERRLISAGGLPRTVEDAVLSVNRSSAFVAVQAGPPEFACLMPTSVRGLPYREAQVLPPGLRLGFWD